MAIGNRKLTAAIEDNLAGIRKYDNSKRFQKN